MKTQQSYRLLPKVLVSAFGACLIFRRSGAPGIGFVALCSGIHGHAGVSASKTDAATQIRLHQTDSKLLRAIEDALTRIRHEEYGICRECGQPISKARLEAVPWTRWCRDCKERQDSRS